MRTRVRSASLLCAAALGGGCQMSATQSALEGRLGNPLDRLSRGMRQWVAGELPRSGSLLETVRKLPAGDATTARRLLAELEGKGATMVNTLRMLPAAVPATSTHLLRSMSKDLESLVHGKQYRLSGGQLLSQWRTSLHRTPEVLQLQGPILSGPGDLDRTTDPYQVGRQQSWIERLLQRF